MITPTPPHPTRGPFLYIGYGQFLEQSFAPLIHGGAVQKIEFVPGREKYVSLQRTLPWVSDATMHGCPRLPRHFS